MKARKHLYDHIVYDSSNERDFAKDLDTNMNVAVYVKLPDGYVRLSPVQPYREGPGWRRKRILTIVLICAVAAALVAVGILIWKFGIHLPFFKKK